MINDRQVTTPPGILVGGTETTRVDLERVPILLEFDGLLFLPDDYMPSVDADRYDQFDGTITTTAIQWLDRLLSGNKFVVTIISQRLSFAKDVRGQMELITEMERLLVEAGLQSRPDMISWTNIMLPAYSFISATAYRMDGVYPLMGDLKAQGVWFTPGRSGVNLYPNRLSGEVA